LLLTYPKVSPTTSLTLPDPVVGDVASFATKTRLHKTASGEVFTYIYTPIAKRLNFTFATLKTADKDSLRTFLQDSKGADVGLVDVDGNVWTGKFLTNPFTTAEQKDFFEISLDFEGTIDSTDTEVAKEVALFYYGGFDNVSVAYIDNDEYTQVLNAPGAWASKADMPSPTRSRHGDANVDGKLYTYGGLLDDNATEIADTDEYTPAAGAAGSWAGKTDIPSPARSSQASFGIGGNAYSVGGFNLASANILDNDAFNATGDSWSVKTNMPSPARRAQSGATMHDVGIITGGFSSGYENDVDQYTPSDDAWIARSGQLSANANHRFETATQTNQVNGKMALVVQNPGPKSEGVYSLVSSKKGTAVVSPPKR